MAKKIDFSTDDYDFESDLDMPDFNFGETKIKDDRNPATKLVVAGARGFKDTIKSPENVRNLVRKSLPRGYGSALDVVDHTLGTAKSLYNTTTKEMKPLVNDMRKSAQKLVPAADKVLPKRLSDAFRKFANGGEKSQAQAFADAKEASLQAELGTIFQTTAEENHKSRNEDKANQNIRDGIAFDRHKDTMANLGPMRQGIQQLAEYQRTIGINFQRKSLELQYRSYFLAQEAFEEQKRMSAVTQTNLEGILKNSGLPDYVKLKTSERLKEAMRNKFVGAVGDSLFDKRRGFIRNLGEKLVKSAKDKVQQTADAARMGLGAVDSLQELQELQAQFGPRQSFGEMGAEMGGGAVAESLTNRIAKAAHDRLNKNTNVARGSNRALLAVDQLPQRLHGWANSYKGIGKNNIGADSGIVNWIKDNIKSVLGSQDNHVEGDKLTDTRNPDIFNRRTNRAITDIIPGYLARMYRELQIMRTGNQKIELTEYDFTTNKFLERSAVTRNIFKSIVGEGDKSFLKRDVDEIVKSLSSDDNSLSQEQKDKLGKLLLRNNLRGKESDSNHYKDAGHEVYSGMSMDDREAFSSLFKKFFEHDNTDVKRQVFGRQAANLGYGMSDKRATIQDFVNTNQRDHLEELGILDKEGHIDQEKLQAYLLGDEAFPGGAGSEAALAGMTGRGLRTGQRAMTATQMQAARQQTSRAAAAHQFPPPAAPVAQQQVVSGAGVEELVKAINATNSLTVEGQIKDVLERIEKKINEGIEFRSTDGGPDGTSGGRRGPGGNWWNRSIGGLAGGAWRGGGRLLGGLKRHAFGEGDQQGFIGKNWDRLKSLGGWTKNKLTELHDVYIKGELQPRLLLWKLKAGQYYNEGSTTAITKWSEIKGNLVDENGDIVLKYEDLKNVIGGSSWLGRALSGGLKAAGWAKDQAIGLFGKARRQLPLFYQMGLDTAESAFKTVSSWLDQPQDIYVKGKPDPVLLGITMKAGGYFSRITGKPVTKPSEIDGVILNDQQQVVLDEEMLKGGLLNKDGKPIRIGWKGLLNRVNDIAMAGINKVKKGFGVAKDWLLDKGRKIGGIFGGGGIDIAVGRSTRTSARLLLDIRDMLNDRLPGERTVFAALPDPGPGFLAGAGGKARGLAGRAKDKLIDAKHRVKGWWGSDANKERLADGQMILADGKTRGKNMLSRGKDNLASLFEKYFGKKGPRVGSYEDLMAKEKAKQEGEEKKEEKVEKKRGLLGRGKDGLMGLLGKLRGKKDDEDEEGKKKHGLLEDVEDLAGGGSDGRGRGRRSRLPKEKAPKGFLKKIGHYGGRGLRGLGRGALSLGRGAMGLVGLGGVADAIGAGASLLPAVGSAAVAGGGAVLSGLGTLGGWAGAAAAGLGSLISLPVLLGAGAIAGLAVGGYYAYKWATKKRLNTYNKIRYAQYGFLPTDEDHLQQVMGLEDMVKDAVVIDKTGNASFDDKKVDLKKIQDSFGISPDDREHVNNFANWFISRFKPVYLTAAAAIRVADPTKELDDVPDLKPDQKRKYLDIAKFPGGPYNVFTSPFKDQKQLDAGSKEVDSAVAVAEAELKAETEKAAGKGGADGKVLGEVGAVGAAAGAASAAAGAGGATGSPEGVTILDNPDVTMDPGKLGLLKAQTMGTTDDTRGQVSIDGPDVTADIFNSGRIDALTAIRYKTYGLKEMEADKIRALNLLEAEAFKNLTFGKGGKASWSGSVEKIVLSQGANFGIVGVSNDDAWNWISWFNGRFLPTYLAYATALCAATKKTDLKAAQQSVRPIQLVDVATMVYTAKGMYNGNMISVWQINATPWPGYQLNDDVSTTNGNLQGLKDQAQQSTLSEETTKPEADNSGSSKTSGANAPGAPKPVDDKPKGFFQKFADAISTGGPSYMSGSGTGSPGGTLTTAGSTDGGREIAHPGNGTGGDINSIPMPKGNGTWAALKDTIVGAAKMAGVDDKLMATMAAIESGFNYTVKAGTSSATGLFQFIKSTWDTMLRKYGSKYGISPDAQPTDPRANALMGAEFLKENANALAGSTSGRKLTDTDLYFAHFLGAGGAKTLLSADPQTIAANLMPKAAAANPSIFYKDGRPLTVAEVYQVINGRVKSKSKQFGVDDGSEKVATTNPATIKATPESASAAAEAKGGAVAGPAVAGAGPDGKPSVAIPVSDSKPAPSAPVAKAPPAPSSSSAGGGATTPAALAGIGSGIVSPRSRDLAVQNAVQSGGQGNLDTTNQILAHSYDVQVDAAKSLAAILTIMQAAKGSGVTQASAPQDPVAPSKAPPTQRPQREMTKAPVSMAKDAYS